MKLSSETSSKSSNYLGAKELPKHLEIQAVSREAEEVHTYMPYKHSQILSEEKSSSKEEAQVALLPAATCGGVCCALTEGHTRFLSSFLPLCTGFWCT